MREFLSRVNWLPVLVVVSALAGTVLALTGNPEAGQVVALAGVGLAVLTRE